MERIREWEKRGKRNKGVGLQGRGFLFSGIMLLLTAVTFWILMRGVSLSDILAAVEAAKLRWLAGGLLLMLLYVAMEGLCIKMTMETMEERPSLLHCIRYAFIGFYFSGITPSASGGQPAQVYCMGKDRFSFSKSALCLLLISSVYQLAMLMYGAGIYIFQHNFLKEAVFPVRWLLALGVSLNLVLVAAILFMMFSPHLIERMLLACASWTKKLGFWKKKKASKKGEKDGVRIDTETGKELEKETSFAERLRGMMQDYSAGATHIKKNPGLVIALFAITMVRLTILYMMPYFVALSFGISGATVFQMVGLSAMLTLAVSSLPFPGSVGISEGTSLLIFGMMFSSGVLLPAMLLLRGISFYAVLLISGMVLISTVSTPLRQTFLRATD